jgi:hypothetical protein
MSMSELHRALGGGPCRTCSAWSELLARSLGSGPVEAMCLNPASPMHGSYMRASSGCTAHTTDPALADHPSERAPDARPHDESRTAIAAAGKSLGMMEQLRAIFGNDNVVELSAGPHPARDGEWRNDDRVLDDQTVERSCTRKSAISGTVRTLTFIATMDQWAALDRGELIQRALAHLSMEQREFIMTGITQEEWDAAFPEDDEETPGIPDRPVDR